VNSNRSEYVIFFLGGGYFKQMITFVKRQISQIHRGGSQVLFGKMKLLAMTLNKIPFYVLAIPIVLSVRLIRPWLLVRFGALWSSRIGHFAANTELYLCEYDAGINVPKQRHTDLFYMGSDVICNNQLATMWRRVLRIYPGLILRPVHQVNRLIPGWLPHEIGNNTQNDRDVHDLYVRFPPHISFTDEEMKKGEECLREMGIPEGASFVCLMVRDAEYLKEIFPTADFSYHDYRDSDINNYVLAAEALAERGYFVIRMGAKVKSPLNSQHPKIIDYAFNGMRTDFMDIFLGANCEFAITVGTGIDAVPVIFRRPIIHVNSAPLGYCHAWPERALVLAKHHIKDDHECTLSEIFTEGVGFSLHTSDFESKNVRLVENTPEEIRDIALEFIDRLEDKWHVQPDDEELQRLFWKIFPTDAVDRDRGMPLHGKIRARYSAKFLRDNREWLR